MANGSGIGNGSGAKEWQTTTEWFSIRRGKRMADY